MYALNCIALHCTALHSKHVHVRPFCPHHRVAALMLMHTTPCCSLFWVAINSALTHTAHCALHTKMQWGLCNYPRAQIAASGQKVTINARMRMHHYIAPESALLNNKISKRSVFCWFWLKTKGRVKFGRMIDSCAGAPLFSLTVSWLQGSLSTANAIALIASDSAMRCAIIHLCTLSNKIISRAIHWSRWLHIERHIKLADCSFPVTWCSNLDYISPPCTSVACQTIIGLSATVLIGRCSVPPCASACVQWWWPWLYYHTHAPWIDSSPLLAPLALHCNI